MLFCAQGYRMDLDSLRLEEENGRYFVIHEVETGETLYSLSRRYVANLDSIKFNNELRNGGIDLGQILRIPIEAPKKDSVVQIVEELESPTDPNRKTHVVIPGETVYSITKKYDLQFEQLRNWNNIVDNSLSVGMTLYIDPPVSKEVVNVNEEEPLEIDENLPELVPKEDEPDSVKYHAHYVQSGETLTELAKRFETIPDSLIYWNELENTTLRIGDKLLVKKTIQLDSLNHSNPKTRYTPYGSKYWEERTDLDTLIHEEGIAGTIENIIETRKFLALHRSVPVGGVIRVVNLMNHESLEVKVVGKLPDTGLNRNIMIRFTEATFKQLGIIDRKSRVEIIYPEEKG